jgi:hypothetical protein
MRIMRCLPTRVPHRSIWPRPGQEPPTARFESPGIALPTGAYITRALIEAGYGDTFEFGPAISTVRESALAQEDASCPALAARAVAVHDPDEAMTKAALDRLHEMRLQQDGPACGSAPACGRAPTGSSDTALGRRRRWRASRSSLLSARRRSVRSAPRRVAGYRPTALRCATCLTTNGLCSGVASRRLMLQYELSADREPCGGFTTRHTAPQEEARQWIDTASDLAMRSI